MSILNFGTGFRFHPLNTPHIPVPRLENQDRGDLAVLRQIDNCLFSGLHLNRGPWLFIHLLFNGSLA